MTAPAVCDLCGFTAKTPQGLRGHQQFAHGKRKSTDLGRALDRLEQSRNTPPPPPPRPRDEEVSADRLERALEQVSQRIIQQVAQRLDERQVTAHKRLASALDERLESIVSDLKKRQQSQAESPVRPATDPTIPVDPSPPAPDHAGSLLKGARRYWAVVDEVASRPRLIPRRRRLLGGRFL